MAKPIDGVLVGVSVSASILNPLEETPRTLHEPKLLTFHLAAPQRLTLC